MVLAVASVWQGEQAVDLAEAVTLEAAVDSGEAVVSEAAAAWALAPGLAVGPVVEASAQAATGVTVSSSPSPSSAAPNK